MGHPATRDKSGSSEKATATNNALAASCAASIFEDLAHDFRIGQVGVTRGLITNNAHATNSTQFVALRLVHNSTLLLCSDIHRDVAR